jgi:TonB-dependent receptor
MTPKTYPMLSSRTVTRWLFALCLTAGALFAQSTGTITGRVFDQATGRSLQGAVVQINGTGVNDVTDTEGRYTLSGVPAGTATIDVEYVGLDPSTQSIAVAAGSAARLDVGLKSSVLQMQAFEVQEAARGQALAINQQKVAAGIINIVSEETFGTMTAGNIGQALQRLPGISVNEDQDGSTTGFNIRGVESAYNSFQIDGNRVPNTGNTSRAFDARQFEASGVTNIEVIKAPTPDRDGDAIGGIINVVSRSAFQRDGRAMRLKLAGIYSDLPDKWGHSASLQYSDIFSILGKDKNLGISATISSHRVNRYSENADIDWVQVTPEFNPQLNLPNDPPIWFLEANHWEHDTRVTNTRGITGSIDFRTDEYNSFYIRPTYTFADRKGTKFETDIDIDTRFQDEVGGRKTYAYLTADSGGGIAGTTGASSTGSRGFRGWIGTDDIQDTRLYSVSFGGRHERGPSLLTYDLYYSYNKVNVTSDFEFNTVMRPDNPWPVFEYRISDIYRGVVDIRETNGVSPNDLRQMTLGNYIDITSVKEEDVYSGRVDWERKFEGDRGRFTFKTGAKYRSSAPRFDRSREQYTTGANFPYSQVMVPTDAVLYAKPKYFDVYPVRVAELLRTQPNLFTYNPDASVLNGAVADYDAKEETSAAYGMGTFRLGRHQIIAGVRWEKNDWSSTRKDVRQIAGQPGIVTPIHRDASYDFWLPGAHTRHELTRNLILRASYNKSYGRARLAELTRGRQVATNGNITDGNENLQPARSDNYDLQLEYYTPQGGLYSAGIFYKDIVDFTFTRVARFTELDANGNPIIVPVGSFQYSRPENGAAAKNKGLELIARQRLYFLPKYLRGLSVGLSATFTETEAEYPNRSLALGGDGRTGLPLPGFSKELFTASLDYAVGRFNTRLDYRFRSNYVEGLGSNIESDEYFSAEEKVDAEITFRIRKGVSIYAAGTNLTNRPQVSYQGFPQFVEDTSLSGRKYTVGLEYSF